VAYVDGPTRSAVVTELRLFSTSRAEDAGFLAMRDIAAVADKTAIEYRIVGGQMVRLHVALSGATEPTIRLTQDADMGIEAASARDPALVAGLEALGYTRPEASNRFIRATEGGLDLVIDVLTPAWGRRMVSNQRYGEMTVDAIPGLSLALAGTGENVDLVATLLDNTSMSFIVALPSITSALCLKVLGWADRQAGKDAVDVWRLLRAHVQRIPGPIAWRDSGAQGDAVAILRKDFARPAGAGTRAASTDRAEQAEIRALTLAMLRT
jgi:hypothetical protein